MLEISTAKTRQVKRVNIDGHVYSVRKLGAGEQLTMSQYMRKITKVDARIKAGEMLTDAEEEQAEKYSTDLLDILASCFDDGGDGSKAKGLVNSLAPDELQEVIAEIFKDDDKQPDTITAPTS